MNAAVDRVRAVLAAHLDMVKGFLGDQFAVSIVARHKGGPCHMLLGDDAELALIGCLSALAKQGVTVSDGREEAEPTAHDHMVNLLRECAEQFRDYERQHRAKAEEIMLVRDVSKTATERLEKAQRNGDIARRIEQVLDMVAPERKPVHPVDALQSLADRMGLETDPDRMAAARAYCDELVPTPQPEDEQLTRVDGDPLAHLDPSRHHRSGTAAPFTLTAEADAGGASPLRRVTNSGVVDSGEKP